MNLSENNEVKLVLENIDKGNNVFMYGPGGCGKTWTLRKIAIDLRMRNKYFGITASTGCSAVNLCIPDYDINCRTLHSWAGIGLGKDSVDVLYGKILEKKDTLKRWRKTDILLIDEISMIGSILFEKLDNLAQLLRGNTNPFGGLQLIVSGDFLQLSPVGEKWVFESNVWHALNFIPIPFLNPKRYDDLIYFQLLLRARNGIINDEDDKILMDRTKSYSEYIRESKDLNNSSILQIKPTILYSRKFDVSAHNNDELTRLSGDIVKYDAIDGFIHSSNYNMNRDAYFSSLDQAVSKDLYLKVGAQVMLIMNLNVDEKLINGSRGVVIGLDSDGVDVKFMNDNEVRISRQVWSIKDEYAHATRSQIPLILAWAFTIHKTQGATLDFAICDLGPSVFAPGQAYVALSRIRNIKGLFISGYHRKSIWVNRQALNFMKSLNSNPIIEEIESEINNSNEFESEIVIERKVEKPKLRQRSIIIDDIPEEINDNSQSIFSMVKENEIKEININGTIMKAITFNTFRKARRRLKK